MSGPGAALAAFPGISKSRSVTLDGRILRFPTRADYLSWLVAHGHLTKAAQFAEQGELVARVYRHWQAQGQLACRFAQKVAREPEPYGLHTCVIDATSAGKLPPKAAQALGQACRTACDGKDVQALTLLFPRIESPAALVRLLKGLAAMPDWLITVGLNPSDALRRMHVRLQYQVDPGHVAEVLGFGPFEFLPLTRRAPVVSLEMLTSVSRPKDSALGRPKRLHLAGIDLGWPVKRIESVWKATEKNRLALLGGDDSAAKAKVSFAIPRHLWEGHRRAGRA